MSVQSLVLGILITNLVFLAFERNFTGYKQSKTQSTLLYNSSDYEELEMAK